jgi:hypothetical protein
MRSGLSSILYPRSSILAFSVPACVHLQTDRVNGSLVRQGPTSEGGLFPGYITKSGTEKSVPGRYILLSQSKFGDDRQIAGAVFVG